MRDIRPGGRRWWCAVALLLLLAAALPALAADAELAFTKGQDAFQQGDFHKALRYFRQARKADADNPEYAHWEGATLLRLRQHRQAIDVLQEARSLSGSRRLPGLSYDLGVGWYQLQEYDNAEDSLKQALREDPRNHRARFFLALTYKETDRTDAAVAELERIRREDGEMVEEVSLLLGKIYAERGEAQKAAAELRTAASAQNQRIAVLSRDYLRQIRVAQSGSPRKHWSFSGYGAIEYDTNVVLNPEDPGVDFPVSETEDWRTEWWGLFNWNPIARPREVFGLSYGFYQTLHEDLTEFDFQGHLPKVNAIISRGDHTWWGNGGLEYYYLDSDDYLRRWQIENNYFYKTGDSGRLRLYHRYRDDEFFDVPERDGHEHFFGVSQSFFPWDTKARTITLGFGWGDRDSGNDYSYVTRQVDASFFTPMGEVWYFFAALRLSNFDYDNSNSDFNIFREDDDVEVAVRTTYELTEHWNLISEYRYTDHNSNIDFFSYKRHIMTVGITTNY